MTGTSGYGQKVARRAHLAHEFGAIRSGHFPVENDQIRRQRADRFETAAAVGSFVDGLDADRLQQRARHLAHGVLVVDDHHLERLDLPGDLNRDLVDGLFHIVPRCRGEANAIPHTHLTTDV